MNVNDVPIEIPTHGPRFPDGRADYTHASVAPVLNCFIFHEGKMLLLKRTASVGWLKNHWHVVAGFLDEALPLKKKVIEEIREELTLTEESVTSMHALPKLTVQGEKIWIIYRVVVHLSTAEITLDWENSEHVWVTEKDIASYELTPTVRMTAEELFNSRLGL